MSERRERYAQAIDSVLADEFLTGALTPLVVSAADADISEALRELSNRLFVADVELSRMKHQSERLAGKAEGVRLAKSYVDEMVREIEGDDDRSDTL